MAASSRSVVGSADTPQPLNTPADGPGAGSRFDQIVASANLLRAWRDVRANRGAAGADEVTLARFERRLELNLANLAETVRDGSYRPGKVRHVRILCRGKARRLSILSVADRVLQRAALNVLEPAFDRTFLPRSYGYRPRRSLAGAVRRIVTLRDQGYRRVVDADIKDCFPNVDHQILLSLLERRIDDGRVLALFRQWVALDATVRDGRAKGISLGAIVSPLLCNVYLHSLDRALARHHLESVRYADDFVVLCEGESRQQFAFEVAEKHLRALRLELNLRKTCLTDFDAGFTFLGVTFRGDECHYDVVDRHVVFERPPDGWMAVVPDGYA